MKNLTPNEKKDFTSGHFMATFYHVVAKSTTEPGNSNDNSVANNSTPKNNRAFFVCSTRTPKERPQMACSSTVACNGKGFALCCVPLIAVFQPVTRYRQNLENLAVTSEKLFSGVTQMIYSFKALSRRDLSNTGKIVAQMPVYTLKTEAESEEQARAKFAPFYCILETLAATVSNKGAIYA